MTGAARDQGERLDGWKSIARHLGRDRSTVIRWAQERDLPVHSLPGGKSRSVYALRNELDAWVRSCGTETEPIDVAPDVALPSWPKQSVTPQVVIPALIPASAPKASHRWWWIGAGLAGLAAIAMANMDDMEIVVGPQPAIDALQADMRAQLLEARDDIASRSEQRLNAAIIKLRALRERLPENPRVHEALAEGYLLAREFGSLPDALAFEKARQESVSALRQDPDSAIALRALGVISYWRDRNPTSAGQSFRHAIKVAPQDALAHQWYANILSDNGEDAAAFREFTTARQANPGAAYLLADYGWALWSAGQNQKAETVLADLAARHSGLASIHDCLSVTAFARGDHAGYARALRQRALARGAPELISYSKMVDEAVTRDQSALYGVMMSWAMAQADASPVTDHSWSAFVASEFGDRTQLLTILKRAGTHDERWGASGFTRRIAQRWSTDPEVVLALTALKQRRIETSADGLRRFAT